MACNPPYARGLTGQWDKCRFPGVLRQDCYEYINFDYDCSILECPNRTIVIQICNSNSIPDDDFKVYLNGTYLGDITSLGTNSCTGAFFIADSSATLDPKDSDLLCDSGGKCSVSSSAIIRFSKNLLIRGKNIVAMENIKDNGRGNGGTWQVRNYLNTNGKLTCPCNVANFSFSGGEGANFPDPFDPKGASAPNFQFNECCPPGTTLCPTPAPTATPGGSKSSDEKTGLFIEHSEYPVFQSFGLDDYSPNFTPIQSDPEPVFSIQESFISCNITARLRTTGCCIELEESTGRMYAVGAGTVSASVISGLSSKCCPSFKLKVNGKRSSNTVRDGEPIDIQVDSNCNCTKKNPWRTPGGFKPGPCNKGPAPTPGPFRILKNTETGVYQIQLNLNTSSGQNDCGCG
jgi:hypothetical protein